MKSTWLPMIAAVSVLWAAPVLALDLHEARAGGMVGEKLDGYVAVIKGSGEVNSLVAGINAKRRAEYERISKENGQPVDVVAKLAAQQVMGKLKPGEMYQAADGSWKKR